MPSRVLGPHAADELVGEALRGRVVDRQLGAPLVQVVGDRAEQVGLAEPRGAVEEERVVGLARRLGDGQRGPVGEPVPGPDHEALEGVGGVQGDPRRGLVGRVRGAVAVLRARGIPGELDLVERCVGPRQRGPQQLGVAPADPAADVRGTGEEEGRAAPARRAQRLEPEAIGGLGDRSADVELGPPPVRVECSLFDPPSDFGLLARLTRSSPSASSRRAPGGRDHSLGPVAPEGAATRRRCNSRGKPAGPTRAPYTPASGEALRSREATAPVPSNEAHLPAQEAQARANPRIPGPQRHPVGTGDPQAPAAEGPQAPHPLIVGRDVGR